MMKILLINPLGIGDVIFSTPVIEILHKHFPGSYIGYICNRRVADILETNSCVNRVTGIIVPPSYVDALAQAMFSLLSDENKRHVMSLKAERRFSRLFTLDATVNNYVALYDRMTS